jgi:hypothetical protein
MPRNLRPDWSKSGYLYRVEISILIQNNNSISFLKSVNEVRRELTAACGKIEFTFLKTGSQEDRMHMVSFAKNDLETDTFLTQQAPIWKQQFSQDDLHVITSHVQNWA